MSSTREMPNSLKPVDIDCYYIGWLSEQLDLLYQAKKLERLKLASWEEEKPFSILGVIELLSLEVQGYATQVEVGNYTASHTKIIEHLRQLNILKVDYFAQWYFQNLDTYPQTKQYIEQMDHLRLRLIESFSQDLAAVA